MPIVDKTLDMKLYNAMHYFSNLSEFRKYTDEITIKNERAVMAAAYALSLFIAKEDKEKIFQVLNKHKSLYARYTCPIDIPVEIDAEADVLDMCKRYISGERTFTVHQVRNAYNLCSALQAYIKLMGEKK